jgi:zinc finger protein
VPPNGRRITLLTIVDSADTDLKRELFKSDTCGVRLPELDLELSYGTLGGVYTTVEGLLEKITDHLKDINTFVDSDEGYAARMRSLMEDLEELRNGRKPFTMILDDPLGFSFLQNPWHPEKDMCVRLEVYERTFEQNEDLGLNDIKV